jgi:phospholipase/carboxylesterase/glyoxalase family protein
MSDLGFIHRYIPGTSSTTLLFLHGTGGDENDLLPLGEELAPDAHVLSPRGKVLENGMPRFFRRLALGVFDIEDLKHRTHELADFVTGATDAYNLGHTKLIAVAYSNGANIAASMLLLRPEMLDAAALLHPMVPFEVEDPPNLAATSVLMTGGLRDPIVPREQTQRLAEVLAGYGADLSLQFSPGGHELTREELIAVREWISKLAT